jgi:hypothetical protein
MAARLLRALDPVDRARLIEILQGPGAARSSLHLQRASGTAGGMTLSIYDASIPRFVTMLGNLSAILAKTEAHAAASGTDPASLMEARLAPDMFALPRQVQIATDGVKACAARMAGIETPSFPDTETTLPELRDRIARTIAFLTSVPAAAIDGAEDRTITFKLRGTVMSFTGRDYLLGFVLPNFYFHLTTAYTILRHQGVPIGKQDFLGAF